MKARSREASENTTPPRSRFHREEGCTEPPGNEKNHKGRKGEGQRDPQRHECERNSAAAVPLDLRAEEPDDRPGEHGQRSGTSALHGVARERKVSVGDV